METVMACALIPTPGIAAGLFLAPWFVPVLVSHLRHGRTLGPLGYAYSSSVVALQAVGVVLLVVFAPFSAPMNSTRDWLIWAASLMLVSIGVVCWFRRASRVPKKNPG